LFNGKKWMDEVLESLEKRQLPRATPPSFPPPTVELRIGDPKCGDLLVRLIDYSGELINPDAEADPESLTTQLKHHLSDCDGLLILAETPRSSEPGTLARELRLLREAFHSLRQVSKDPIRTPVGVLITKWDRYSQIDFENPHRELKRLQVFLRERPEYLSLVQSIRSAVGGEDQLQSLTFTASAEELQELQAAMVVADASSPSEAAGSQSEPVPHQTEPILAVPVSAFGQSRSEDGKEFPPEQLRPFNALEPFAWLAKRRDELQLMSLLERWMKMRKWWWVPMWFTRPSLRKLRADIRQLGFRLARGSPLRGTWAATRRRITVSLVLSTLAFLAYMAILGDAGISVYHYREFKLAEEAANSPDVTLEQLNLHLTGLQSWPKRLYTGFFLELFISESSRDKLMNSLAARAAGIRDSLDERALKQRVEENRQALERLRAEWPKDQTVEVPSGYWKKVREFKWPHSDAANLDLQQQLQELQAKVEAWFWEITLNDLAEKVRKHLDNGEIGEAIKELLTIPRDKRSERWIELAEVAVSRIPDVLQRECQRYLSIYKYEEALKQIGSAEQDLKNFEVLTRESFRSVAEKIIQARQQVTSFREDVCRQYDKHLYSQVQQERSKPACDEYLQKMPIGAMKAYVEAYRQYLEAMEQPLKVRLAVRIHWGGDYIPDDGRFPPPGENFVWVYADDYEVLHVGPIHEKPGELSPDVGSFNLENRSALSSISFKVVIREDDSPYLGWDDGGSGEKRLTLKEIYEGNGIILLRPNPETAEGRVFENKAVFRLTEGWPREPELPPWRR
jgi:hypothetical protein